jgi:hypothetical protein
MESGESMCEGRSPAVKRPTCRPAADGARRVRGWRAGLRRTEFGWLRTAVLDETKRNRIPEACPTGHGSEAPGETVALL